MGNNAGGIGYGFGPPGGSGGGGGITSIPINNTIYVDVLYGNDATGLVDRLDKPFQSIPAALAVATPGDMINLHAGDYFIFANMLKDGVNYYAEEGVFLNIFAIPFNANTLGGGTTLTIPFYFGGYAKVVTCSQPLVVTNANPLANLTIEMDDVNITNISNGIVLLDGLTHLIIKNNWTVAGRSFSMRNTGNLRAEIGGLVTTTFANVNNGNFWISNTNWSGTAYIKAESFVLPVTAVGANFSHIYMDNLVGGKLHVELEYLTDTSLVTQAMIRMGNAFAVPSTAQTVVILNIKQISLASRALFNIQDAFAVLYLNGNTASCNGGSISAGQIIDYDMVIISTLTLSVSGGQFISKGGAIVTVATPGVVPVTITGGQFITVGGFLSADTAEVWNVSGTGQVISAGSGGVGLTPIGDYLGSFNIFGTEIINTQVDTTGAAAVSINDFIQQFIYDPAALVANLVITMPAAFLDDTEVKISFGGTITVGAVVTTLSIIGAGADVVLGGAAITTANAGDGYILKYQQSTGIWRIY